MKNRLDRATSAFVERSGTKVEGARATSRAAGAATASCWVHAAALLWKRALHAAPQAGSYKGSSGAVRSALGAELER